jgi:hypothetical protein
MLKTTARIAAIVALLSILGACASAPPDKAVSTAQAASPAWYAGTLGIAD